MEVLTPNHNILPIPHGNLTPDQVRGFSLSELENVYGSLGLYTRLETELDRNGLLRSPDVAFAMHLGLMLHGNDMRTNGPYNDHIMRVTIRIMANYGIQDSSIISAALLHDSIEDHPNDILRALGTSRNPELGVQDQAIDALRKSPLSDISVEMIDLLTCPELSENNKREEYIRYTEAVVYGSPAARIIKLSDFVDNAVGNHHTIGSKQQRLDKKYLPLYRVHKMGLLMPDSLIVGDTRDAVLAQLTKGHFRAMARVGMHEASSQKEHSSQS